MDIEKNIHAQVSKKTKRPLAHAVGRRKAAVARAWVKRGDGVVEINGMNVSQYFELDVMRDAALHPLAVMPAAARHYSVQVIVFGGGKNAQAGAIKLAIARAFMRIYDDARSIFKPLGLVTRDPRQKERKKYGQKGARARFQFVKR